VSVTKQTDHQDQAVALLPSQDKDKTNTESLVKSLAKPIQTFEDTAYLVLTGFLLDTAIGVQLDVLGDIVGQSRLGFDDTTYRSYIRARIAANTSSGTTDTLTNIASLVVNDSAATFELENQSPAAFVLRTIGVVLDDATANILIDFLVDAKAAGVRALSEYFTVAASLTFSFATSTFADGAISGSSTTLTVDSTAKFPASGTLRLSAGLAVDENVTYTSKTATEFTCSATANAHVDDTTIQLVQTGRHAWGDEAAAGTGGYLKGVKDARYETPAQAFPVTAALLAEKLGADTTVNLATTIHTFQETTAPVVDLVGDHDLTDVATPTYDVATWYLRNRRAVQMDAGADGLEEAVDTTWPALDTGKVYIMGVFRATTTGLADIVEKRASSFGEGFEIRVNASGYLEANIEDNATASVTLTIGVDHCDGEEHWFLFMHDPVGLVCELHSDLGDDTGVLPGGTFSNSNPYSIGNSSNRSAPVGLEMVYHAVLEGAACDNIDETNLATFWVGPPV
jgi:hypothetical protein